MRVAAEKVAAEFTDEADITNHRVRIGGLDIGEIEGSGNALTGSHARRIVPVDPRGGVKESDDGTVSAARGSWLESAGQVFQKTEGADRARRPRES